MREVSVDLISFLGGVGKCSLQHEYCVAADIERRRDLGAWNSYTFQVTVVTVTLMNAGNVERNDKHILREIPSK